MKVYLLANSRLVLFKFWSRNGKNNNNRQSYGRKGSISEVALNPIRDARCEVNEGEEDSSDAGNE